MQPARQDVVVGAAIAGGRLGWAAVRLTVLPARVAIRAPIVGPRVDRAVSALGRDGAAALADARVRLAALAEELLHAPELERAADLVLAGPLVDVLGRSLAEHRVVERVASQVLEQADLDAIADAILEDPRTERLVVHVLESRLLDELTERVLESPELQRVVEHVASSPEVLAAVSSQTETLAGEVVADVRARSERADDAIERRVRGWLHRPRSSEL